MAEHQIRTIIRGNDIYYVCDKCNKEFKQGNEVKTSKGRGQEYVYCPECAKELYPNYRKIQFYNPNPVMKNIMVEANARREHIR